MHVSLLGNDLILASKVQAVARDSGSQFHLYKDLDALRASLETPLGAPGDSTTGPPSQSQFGALDLMFVDLNFGDDGISSIAELHARHPQLAIVAFCGHEEKARRQQAMAAGATFCVTNGAVAQTARRLIADGRTDQNGGSDQHSRNSVNIVNTVNNGRSEKIQS
jgi:CheY-like chemotaxis protein